MIRLTCLLLLCAPLAAETVPLAQLDLSQMRQGWGQPQIDRGIRSQPLSIGGHGFAHGVGTHADSALWIDLHGECARFTAFVGLDDAAGGDQTGSIQFLIYVDGNLRFDSGVMRLGDAAEAIELDLTGCQQIALLVTDAGDGIAYDHADWAEAEFLTSGRAPTALAGPVEERVRLTPYPPATPQINGPDIFGARPGSPFLYTIPCTGQRPLKYQVHGLPEGLTVNAENGQITGVLGKVGRYEVMFEVSNALGRDRRRFTIVCGDRLALTPHMGWNSWYIHKARVDDAIMRAAADAMVATGMIDFGYQYVNIDDGWSIKPGSTNPLEAGPERDDRGRILANGKFPDMPALTAYIHGLGLKAGLYSSPGPLTCGRYVGSFGHEAEDAAQFAAWGFDFLKYDWCSYGHEADGTDVGARQKPYRLIGDLLKPQPRDIVLNLCQYGMSDVWDWGQDVGGHSWRTAGDLGGSYLGIAGRLYRDGLDLYAAKALDQHAGPGGWNDPDYLLCGDLDGGGRHVPTSMTANEQYTQVTFWAMAAAPRIFSGDMTTLDDFTLGLLCNREVIAVDQDRLGRPAHRVSKTETGEVWTRPLADGTLAVALFSRSEVPATVTVNWSELGLTGRRPVRDMWRQQDLGLMTGYEVELPRHGTVMLKVGLGDEHAMRAARHPAGLWGRNGRAAVSGR